MISCHSYIIHLKPIRCQRVRRSYITSPLNIIFMPTIQCIGIIYLGYFSIIYITLT
nr:MAG TPA: hypothetical protein [Bacteriophage sp.]